METILKTIDHFSRLSPTQLKRLIEESNIQNYRADDSILSPEQSPDFYSFLIQGKWWMQRQIVGTESPRTWIDDRPGNWHGGIGLIDKVAPPLVKATTDCTVIHIPRDVLDSLAAENPHLAVTMLRGISGGSTLLYEHALANSTDNELGERNEAAQR
ncbi:MAG: Crp/Fnr family transcriptional regulator [Leptolyngbyaceae cyanobacterium]